MVKFVRGLFLKDFSNVDCRLLISCTHEEVLFNPCLGRFLYVYYVMDQEVYILVFCNSQSHHGSLERPCSEPPSRCGSHEFRVAFCRAVPLRGWLQTCCLGLEKHLETGDVYSQDQSNCHDNRYYPINACLMPQSSRPSCKVSFRILFLGTTGFNSTRHIEDRLKPSIRRAWSLPAENTIKVRPIIHPLAPSM